ncbi:MAG TPA: ParA family protein [Corynebacteriales bacterium]|nr:ParA family protein [Mycobacteriales bacterium]
MTNYSDTPIAEAADQASRIIHRYGLEQFERPGFRRTIAVANQKGGVGKTTTAVNLAAALGLYGMRVLVIDLDPQGNASTALGAEHRAGTPSSYELMMGINTASECVQQSTAGENVFVIPATIDLAGSEIELVSMVAREHRLLEALRDDYIDELDVDFIFIDCPPSLGLLTINAMVAAQEILLPIQCEYYALEGVGQLLNNIKLIKSHLNKNLHLSTIILTMFDGRTRLADQVEDEVRNHFGDIVLDTVIPRSVKVSEAPGFSQTVIQFDPGSAGSKTYLEAAKEIIIRSGEMEEANNG